MERASRKLGFITATTVVLGNIVGVMIFLTQGTVAKHLPWERWVLFAWTLGGVLAKMGALCVLCSLMKGHIEVESTVGEGATFSVYFPNSSLS